MPASSASSITGIVGVDGSRRCRSRASIGTVVSTQKHRKFEGAKLLLVQPLDARRHAARRRRCWRSTASAPASTRRCWSCSKGARPARRSAGRRAPVDAAIIGIVDAVDIGDGMNDEQELRALVREADRAASRRPERSRRDRSGPRVRPSHVSHLALLPFTRRRRRRRVPDRAGRALQPLRVLPVVRALRRQASRRMSNMPSILLTPCKSPALASVVASSRPSATSICTRATRAIPRRRAASRASPGKDALVCLLTDRIDATSSTRRPS